MIGLFDSGVGGLGVLREVRALLPRANLTYIADQARVPYGDRTLRELRDIAEDVTKSLLLRGATTVVIACNTASAAALKHLRAIFPTMPFVGMEPALKPACEQSISKIIGVIATQATFQGELFASLMERHAHGITVLIQACPGLVDAIERGELDLPSTEHMLRGWLQPMLARGMDALVLGCTHYPFVRPLIERICDAKVRVIDPAPAVARQVVRVAGDAGANGNSEITMISTGDQLRFETQARVLLDMRKPDK